MTVALLSTGSELLRGEVVNTNASWLAEHLSELGHQVAAIEVVGDTRQELVASIERLTTAHPLVVVTGGLGPTTDDLTATAAAEQAGVELMTNEEALADIQRWVVKRAIPLRASHAKQAKLPAGSEMIPNETGTAPGFVMRSEGCVAFYLPGVPSEMRMMFEQYVAPRVGSTGDEQSYSICLHTVGVGESWLADQLDDLELGEAVTIGFRARTSEVDVRLAASGNEPTAARSRVEHAAELVRERLGAAVYGVGEQSMPLLAASSVRNKGWRLAVAESCTGGLIAQQLTSIPASDYFMGGVVTYADSAKTSLLGVSEDTLRAHGAVSPQIAAEMANGARRAFDCEVAVSVTGIAGPTGATANKAVGLCYWAVAHPGGTVVEDRVFSGDRKRVQHRASFATLDLLRRTLN
jgi:nicotinamide-nucleotide amidase